MPLAHSSLKCCGVGGEGKSARNGVAILFDLASLVNVASNGFCKIAWDLYKRAWILDLMSNRCNGRD